MPRGKKVDIAKYLTNIEPIMKSGCSMHEACLHANVPYTTMRDYYDKDEDVRRKIDAWGNWDIVLARQSVVQGFEDDPRLALEYLKNKKSEEFSTKSKQDISATVSLSEKLAEMDDPD